MDYGIFIQQPFAETGDRQEVPFEAQPSNVVSWTTGWTIDYTLNIATDPRAKAIERQKNNYLTWAMSSILSQYQRQGTPEWVSASDNGGNPLGYAIGATVIKGGVYYVSTTENNVTEPGVGPGWQAQVRIAATDSQALAGTSTTTLITPATLKAVLDQAPGGVPASTTVAGITRYATTAETTAGLLGSAAVTPAGLKPSLDAKANASNPAISGRVGQTLPGAPNVDQTTWELGANNGLLRWSQKLNGADGSLTWVGRDAAGANPLGLITMFPQPTVFGNISNMVMSFGGSIYVVGRVQADVAASETLSSTTRYATWPETQAGSAVALAISPDKLRAYTAQYYAPINNANFTGTTSVRSNDVGFRWVNPDGRARFYTNAEQGGTKLMFAGCNEAGTFNRILMQMDRLSGTVEVQGDLTSGTIILAPVFRSTSARWKKNLERHIENPLEELAKYQAWDGTWKSDAFEGAANAGDQWFLVADDVAEQRPSLCGFDELGRADSVNYVGYIPLLIAGVNELTEQNKALRAELDELREMVRSLINKESK